MNLRCAFVVVASVSLLPVLAFGEPVIDRAAAPLDEYFGAQKMSALGIRMRIDDLGRRYHAHALSDADALHDASIAEDSYHAWERRYPRDRWLAPTAFHLEQLYAEVQLPDGRKHATAMLHFIATTFPTTSYGHLSRLRLAQGLPPLRAQSALTAAPGVASSASPEAVASVAPAASDVPAAGPSAGASRSPLP